MWHSDDYISNFLCILDNKGLKCKGVWERKGTIRSFSLVFFFFLNIESQQVLSYFHTCGNMKFFHFKIPSTKYGYFQNIFLLLEEKKAWRVREM